MTRPLVAFAGMTHLGLVSGVAAAEKGFKVVCYDPAAARIAALQKRDLPVSEPQLEHLVVKNAERLAFTADAAELRACDVIYVAPDVPTDERGASDLGPIDALLARVFDAARPGAVIVVLSQVPPGFTRGLAFPPERLFYQVETLVFGRAVERALKPERFIVGCVAPEKPLPKAYVRFLAAFGCPILPMRYESAELAKIAVNCCLAGSVSVANTLAELCERIGAVWSEITPALRLDERIGPHAYLAPGLGIAGGNLERDLATVVRLAEENGTDAGVVKAWIANSRHRRDWAARTIKVALLDKKPDAIVAVWGLAYKENTDSVKNSPSLATIAQLPGMQLRLHDPVVPAASANRPGAVAAANPLEAAKGADALMILTPWPQYRKIAPARLASAMRGRVVLDPYGVLEPKAAAKAGLELHSLGRPAMKVANA